MTDAILVEQALEPGRVDRARELFAEIDRMADDQAVVDVLRSEGVHTESAFLQHREDGDYVLYYIEAEDGEQVKDVFDALVDDPEGETDGLAEFVRAFDAVTAGEPQLADAEPLYHLVDPERPDHAGREDRAPATDGSDAPT
ncbi:DUF6176 family protein [Halorussus halobius]|uniref:DUF6176 family protein n=1 Tax=Halorussus halobius TaxID=1710537 RepID=UPI001092C7B7|nr:DUF6176 family protein [Halorussus halobius]